MVASDAANADAQMPRTEEAQLIARAQRGRPEAFRALVSAYQQRLYGFVWRLVRDHHEAEDVCQAAFVKAYESLASYSAEYAFSTWLFTIAYRVALNNMRKRKALTGDVDFSRFDAGSDAAADSVANTEEARRMRELVWTAVDDLTPVQKSTVLLFYKENKSCQTIGEILGIPAVTVKSHLHRAREKLRGALEAQLADGWGTIRFNDAASA